MNMDYYFPLWLAGGVAAHHLISPLRLAWASKPHTVKKQCWLPPETWTEQKAEPLNMRYLAMKVPWLITSTWNQSGCYVTQPKLTAAYQEVLQNSLLAV